MSTNRKRALRVLIAALAAELMVVLAWAAIVLVYGLVRGSSVRLFALANGALFSVLLSFVCCLLAAYAAAGGSHTPRRDGALVGTLSAALNVLEVGLLGGAPSAILLISRFVAHCLGGVVGGLLRKASGDHGGS